MTPVADTVRGPRKTPRNLPGAVPCWLDMVTGGRRRLRLVARGASMAPILRDGDALTLDTANTRPQPGEVIALAVDGEFFAHRFLGRGATGTWITAGDARLMPDEPSPAEAFRGVIVGHERRGLRFALRRRVQLALSALRASLRKRPRAHALWQALRRTATRRDGDAP